jgi:hypothetical protein
VRVGVLVTGETAVRAAHCLAAHPGIDEVVVVGPATSKTYRVVDDAGECDLLIGTGPEAPGRARDLGVGLVWDGDTAQGGVHVFGAAPEGLALAMAARETDPQLVAVAYPGAPVGEGRFARLPKPVGRVNLHDTTFGGRPIAVGPSRNAFAAALSTGVGRRVTIVDDGAFLAGVALAAGAAVDGAGAVWEDSLAYLRAATEMGLVMAEESG